MKRYSLLLISCLLIRCNMEKMINESTCSIEANRQTVERSSEAIRQNTATIRAANKVIEENHHLLEQASKG